MHADLSTWEMLNQFKHTAFRLEARDRYNELDEAAPLARFLAGQEDDFAWLNDWSDLVRTATDAGRRFARVRVVSTPLSDYSRFGLRCAAVTGAAGEDIRYLPRDQAADLPNVDYWLFDSSVVVQMNFDADDAFTGRHVITDPQAVVRHNFWRDAAWHHAVRRDDFAGQHLGRS